MSVLMWVVVSSESSIVVSTGSMSIGGLVEFYGISTFVGYLTPNSFLCK